MSHATLALLLVTVAADSLVSQPLPSRDEVDMALGACVKSAAEEQCMSTYYVTLKAQRQQVLARLRTTWQRAPGQTTARPTAADLLEKSELTWIEYRNNACDFEARMLGTGATSSIARISCRISMTIERARYLQRFIDTAHHGAGLRTPFRPTS
jgi:uncharacterized protein YecT (DUF1311 family)